MTSGRPAPRIVLPKATKDSLKAMREFKFG